MELCFLDHERFTNIGNGNTNGIIISPTGEIFDYTLSKGQENNLENKIKPENLIATAHQDIVDKFRDLLLEAKNGELKKEDVEINQNSSTFMAMDSYYGYIISGHPGKLQCNRLLLEVQYSYGLEFKKPCYNNHPSAIKLVEELTKLGAALLPQRILRLFKK